MKTKRTKIDRHRGHPFMLRLTASELRRLDNLARLAGTSNLKPSRSPAVACTDLLYGFFCGRSRTPELEQRSWQRNGGNGMWAPDSSPFNCQARSLLPP